MHSIQVDDEVMAYLKRRAEPFIDTPNSVLRRELLAAAVGGATRTGPAADDSAKLLPELPVGTPKALAQILEVAHLVTRRGMNRQQATKFVARHHGVATQTVNDKYGRQANLDAASFDQLLAEPALDGLKKLLRSRFLRHSVVIDEVLG